MSLLNPSLEAFWAVVQAGTVLKAAESVQLTQTGVTQRIRTLEKQLGVTLFTRSRKGMQLTQEGEALLHYVKGARDLENETINGFGQKKQMTPPEISICVSPGLSQTRVFAHMRTLIKGTPLLKLKVLSAPAEESLRLLKTAEVQLALIFSPPKVREMETKKLPFTKLLFVGPAKFKKEPWKTIIEHERFIFSDELPPQAQLLMQKNNLLKSSGIAVPYISNALELAAQGLGYTLCFEEQLKLVGSGKQSVVPLESRMNLELPVSLLWYPRKNMPVYFQKTVQELSQRT